MRAAIVKKQKLVQEIQTNLQNSRAIIFYNFHHIDNEKLFALRKELKKVFSFRNISSSSVQERDQYASGFWQNEKKRKN